MVSDTLAQASHLLQGLTSPLRSPRHDRPDTSNPRYFTARGFDYCSMLNDATFDALVPWAPLNGSVASRNPKMSEFTSLIDGVARTKAEELMVLHGGMLPEHAKRYTCYLAGEGNNPLVASTSSVPLMKSVDPYVFLRDVLPTLDPISSHIPGPRRHYKLAYLILLHEMSGMNSYKHFLAQLDDGDALILVHADPRDPNVERQLQEWANQRAKEQGRLGNIFFCQHKYEGVWGHMALVWMELSGFWELLDIADWDYAINLSGFDWPMRSNREIHRTLSKPAYRGKSFIHYWNDTHQTATRFYRPHVAGHWGSLKIPKEGGLRHLPVPIADWKSMKQSQWMILTEDFVRHLRTDRKALLLAAFMENIGIPDESYFATVLWNTPQFHERVVNSNKRFIRIWGAHPHWLHDSNREDIPPQATVGEEATFFWIRKVNAAEDRDFVEWIQKEHIDKHRVQE